MIPHPVGARTAQTDRGMRAEPATDASPPLERDAELAELAALAAAARSGSGRVVVVEGPAGIGKTRLLEVACSDARVSGMSVLSARGAEMERDLGFGAVHQLFGVLVRRVSGAERRRLFAGTASLVEPLVLGVADGGQPSAEDRFVALHGLYWLCANLAERAPLVLAVDDAHWVDLPTLRWLQFLSRRLDGLPILVVIAIRSDEPLVDGEELAEIRAAAETRTLRLSQLSGPAVAAMVRAKMGQS